MSPALKQALRLQDETVGLAGLLPTPAAESGSAKDLRQKMDFQKESAETVISKDNYEKGERKRQKYPPEFPHLNNEPLAFQTVSDMELKRNASEPNFRLPRIGLFPFS